MAVSDPPVTGMVASTWCAVSVMTCTEMGLGGGSRVKAGGAGVGVGVGGAAVGVAGATVAVGGADVAVA